MSSPNRPCAHEVLADMESSVADADDLAHALVMAIEGGEKSGFDEETSNCALATLARTVLCKTTEIRQEWHGYFDPPEDYPSAAK